jgi:hypothetical protein
MNPATRTPRRRARQLMQLGLASIAAVAAACSPQATPEQDPSREASAPADTEATALPFEWPTLPGWRSETIPFPLDFAPEIPYAGLEELRFAPGMFTAGSDEFWTYAFVWWLEGDVRFDAETLNAKLVDYYEGLSLAVEDSAGFDPKDAVASASLVEKEPADARTLAEPGERESARRFHGTISTHEPFVTHTRIDLIVDAEIFRCAKRDHTVGIFLVSPKPVEDGVWRQLSTLNSTFRCSRP